MPQKPLLTVVTPYYNDQAFLAEAIESVLAQTYPHFEYILINHASTDDSRAIAHQFKDARIKHLDLPFNYGGSGNHLVKTALANAKGEYIKLFSADDILLPNALEKLLQTAQTQQADLVFGDYAFVNQNNQPTGKTFFTTKYPSDLPLTDYLSYLLQGISCFPYAGNFIKTDSLKKISMDEVSIQLADMELWVCLLLNGAKLAFVNTPVAHYRIHSGQMCSASNLDVIALRCQFEHLLFYRHILQTRPTLSLLKKIFPRDEFISRLTEQDTPLFSFVFAHALYQAVPKAACRLVCRLHLADLLNNENLRTQIEQKFAFTLKDLREDIVEHPILLHPIVYPLARAADKTAFHYKWGRKIVCRLLQGFLRLKYYFKGIKGNHTDGTV